MRGDTILNRIYLTEEQSEQKLEEAEGSRHAVNLLEELSKQRN